MNHELGLSIKVETYSCFEVEIYQQGARTPLAGEYARSRPSLQMIKNMSQDSLGRFSPQNLEIVATGIDGKSVGKIRTLQVH